MKPSAVSGGYIIPVWVRFPSTPLLENIGVLLYAPWCWYCWKGCWPEPNSMSKYLFSCSLASSIFSWMPSKSRFVGSFSITDLIKSTADAIWSQYTFGYFFDDLLQINKGIVTVVETPEPMIRQLVWYQRTNKQDMLYR